ncbi:hypothetical protein E3E31_12180 [Thermococcus sp. M39]|uniref:hypothetical protein n=1 Tax=Thermococcus sp. M39 TaxID=1638262 RepID=UPI00143BFD48|nr:hypothetical protein [Thermococcus sp. M39]NJE09266.1 hypothetical protein [Thermococcus sp. M39]
MLTLPEIEGIMDKMKLRLLIQEVTRITGADAIDSVILFRDKNLLILLLFEKRPGKINLPRIKECHNVKLWALWREGNKIYAQEVNDKEIIPLELTELDAFIDLILS